MVWVIVLSAAVLVGAFWYGSMRGKELTETGRIIKRPSSFWEREEIFYTKADFDAIVAGTRSADFGQSNTTLQLRQSSQTIDFSNGRNWRARLKYDGFRNGEHQYTFSFTGWQQRKGIPWGVDKMNMAETSLEKLFLRADPMTMVEMRRGQYSTKTNFI